MCQIQVCKCIEKIFVSSSNYNDELIRSLGHIAKAKGMSAVAKESGLGRESLYKALTVGSQPRFETISKVISALGLKISVHA
jgi:probable addiction module antidote protein